MLGIRLVHSRPYSPQGRGTQERLNCYIRQRFLAGAEAIGMECFEVLNDRFIAWAEQVCNARILPRPARRPSRGSSSGGPAPGRGPRRSSTGARSAFRLRYPLAVPPGGPRSSFPLRAPPFAVPPAAPGRRSASATPVGVPPAAPGRRSPCGHRRSPFRLRHPVAVPPAAPVGVPLPGRACSASDCVRLWDARQPSPLRPFHGSGRRGCGCVPSPTTT